MGMISGSTVKVSWLEYVCTFWDIIITHSCRNQTANGPRFPVAPTGPAGPTGPDGPLVPGGPVSPVLPVGPRCPEAPVGPRKPVAPVTPANPAGPVAPVNPVFPLWPVSPGMPCNQNMIHCCSIHIATLTSRAGGRHNMPPPLQVDLWPFDLENDVRVTCEVGYLYANFRLPRPLCSRLKARCTRQTNRRQTRIIAFA